MSRVYEARLYQESRHYGVLEHVQVLADLGAPVLEGYHLKHILSDCSSVLHREALVRVNEDLYPLSLGVAESIVVYIRVQVDGYEYICEPLISRTNSRLKGRVNVSLATELNSVAVMFEDVPELKYELKGKCFFPVFAPYSTEVVPAVPSVEKDLHDDIPF